VSSSGCSILLYVHVYVRGRVGGRLSPLPEDANILGSGDVFFGVYVYGIILSIVHSILYIIFREIK